MEDTRNIQAVITDSNCTGCGACMNVCPTLAIAMSENAEGFIMPAVDGSLCVYCGKCVHVCPALHVVHDNDPAPVCYAFRAPDEIRAESSSGGFFTVIAQDFLASGGHVCGAVFDGDFNVRHVLASNWEKTAPMRSSKYVQSNIEFVYKKIKTLLDKGENVLFTGTPCQVAGLNSYLQKTYDNLLTVDVICHGVPSQKIFRRHLEEVAKGRKITNVNFRDKRYGWNSTVLHVDFADGSSYAGKDREDAYEAGFHPNLFLRKACADCPFSTFPRQGDVTMGDFWGYWNIEPEFKEWKGTSMLFANNARGKSAITKACASAPFLRQVKWDYQNAPNRLRPVFAAHGQRERFFKLAQSMPLAKAVRYARDRYFDVCIVGNYLNENFGSIMTYYALYNVVTDLGYSALMVDRPRSAPCKPVPAEKLLEKGSYPACDLSAVREDKWHMRDLNNHAQTFLVGSDQLFNASVHRAYDGFTSLDWVQNNKKKLAYAASCGHDDVWCADAYRAEMSYFLKQFDAISVREKSAVEVFRRVFDVDATQVMDPVFLCADKHWERLASLSPEQGDAPGSYVSGYILDPDQTRQKVVEAVCAARGLPYRLYTEFGRKNDFYLKVEHTRVNTQLKQMRDCGFFVTDSFHGVCFSIIFKKDFIVIANRRRGYTRFLSILEQAGLMHKLIHSWDEFEARKDILLRPIDYSIVYAKLRPQIDASRQWLKSWLARPLRKPLNDYDLAVKLVADMRARLEHKFTKEFARLEEQARLQREDLQGKLAYVLGLSANGYNNIQELPAYLQKLNAEKQDIVIVIAVRDTPANRLSAQVQEAMQKLGLGVNLDCQFRKSYLAVIDGGNVACEQISNASEALRMDADLPGCKIAVFSASYEAGDKAEIKINGNDYSVNKRGLNFAIIDKKTGFVMDAVNFDTWLPHAPAQRK